MSIIGSEIVPPVPKFPPPLAYLNCRVYASGLPGHEASWYNRKEQHALRAARLVLTLSEKDRQSVRALLPPTRANDVDIHVLLPPLRAAIHALAGKAVSELISAMPAAAQSALPPPANPASPRRFVSCVVRLSPEKEPMRFVELVRALGPALEELGLTPLLVGSAAHRDYAARVVSELKEVAPSAIVIESFLGPHELAAVFSATALNVHPSSYDAYGMTIVEAAAFGAPSLVNGNGSVPPPVGASELLSVKHGTAFELPLSEKPMADLAPEVVGILRDKARLEACGKAAKKRALEWNEEAYGERLVHHLKHVIGCR